MKWVKDLNYEKRLNNLKLQFLEKKKDKKRFDSESQDPIQPNWPGSKSIVKFSRRPGLRRAPPRPLQQTGEPGEEGTVLHGELLSTETVCHLQ